MHDLLNFLVVASLALRESYFICLYASQMLDLNLQLSNVKIMGLVVKTEEMTKKEFCTAFTLHMCSWQMYRKTVTNFIESADFSMCRRKELLCENKERRGQRDLVEGR